GGEGYDTITYSDSAEAVNIDLATGAASGGDAEGDVFNGIERVGGSAHDDVLLGDDQANSLYGYAGNDLLNGAGGNDYLKGYDGNDTIFGGDGNDSIIGDAGADALSGGNGNDVFRYYAIQDFGDSISDFNNTTQSDSLWFSNDVFAGTLFDSADINGYTGQGGFCGSSDAHFIYDSGLDQLWYDANGDDAGGETLIADLNDVDLTESNISIA
ncbi:MAG: hypothetical protein JW718_01295, partial [Desulfovibrionaceae bacterium]|nr:hypothetical protein [Desulfovibrionaceae bacterium]